MIHVEPQPEPEDFDEKVRRPGRKATARGSQKMPALWCRCLDQLWSAYGGVCSYLCVRIARGTGAKTVEHLAPKSKKPGLAYEWSNFRLVCSLMNARKGVFEDVLDPFEVQDGWFILELSSLEVLPAPELKPSVRRRVLDTINRLRLNDKECLKARSELYDEYIKHVSNREEGLTFELLRKWSPFVARELERQNVVTPASSLARAKRPRPTIHREKARTKRVPKSGASRKQRPTPR